MEDTEQFPELRASRIKAPRMSEIFSVELTKEQRDIVLQGLRFVRSSILLDVNDQPTSESQSQRNSDYRRVTELTEHINRAQVLVHS